MSGAKKRRTHSYDDSDSDHESDCEAISSSSSQDSILSTSSSLEQEMEKFREPVASILELIARAIMESPMKMLYLQKIYDYFENRYPYFQVADPVWRNTVRHNLSMNACFVKVARCDVRKGYFWGIHPANLSDFSCGDFTRRRVKSRVQEYEAKKAQSLSLMSPLQHYGNRSLGSPTVTSPTLPPPSQMSFPSLPIQSPLMQALSSPWRQPLLHQPLLRPLLRPILPSPLQWLPSPLQWMPSTNPPLLPLPLPSSPVTTNPPLLPSPLQWMPSSPVTTHPPSLLTPRPPLAFQFPPVPYMMSPKPADQSRLNWTFSIELIWIWILYENLKFLLFCSHYFVPVNWLSFFKTKREACYISCMITIQPLYNYMYLCIACHVTHTCFSSPACSCVQPDYLHVCSAEEEAWKSKDRLTNAGSYSDNR